MSNQKITLKLFYDIMKANDIVVQSNWGDSYLLNFSDKHTKTIYRKLQGTTEGSSLENVELSATFKARSILHNPHIMCKAEIVDVMPRYEILVKGNYIVALAFVESILES